MGLILAKSKGENFRRHSDGRRLILPLGRKEKRSHETGTRENVRTNGKSETSGEEDGDGEKRKERKMLGRG